MRKNTYFILFIIFMLIFSSFLIVPIENIQAYSDNGYDLAYAILADPSILVSSSYWDTDNYGTRQAEVFNSLGSMLPTNGDSFALFSTGIAGAIPVTTNTANPGDESGTYFGVRKPILPGELFDESKLILELLVPQYMHYLYYDVQFFTAEYPDYIGSIYNDKLTITVNSPSQGLSTHVIDVNGGDFVLDSHDIPGTGFDLFAISQWTGDPTDPSNIDWVTRIPGIPGADGGATALVSREHAVSPNEIITLTINIKDSGDNIFDSAAFIDNLMFSGFAKTEIIGRKTVKDLNDGDVECEDILEYHITLSNIGTVGQNNNLGNEFEDFIPDNTEYVAGSAQSSSGFISYDFIENKITWNGDISSESSVAIDFQVKVNTGLTNGLEISNQGIINWDSNEDGTNDAIELTDDPAVDDGIDQDGDGETNDDDPTIVTVTSYELPSELIENFDDDHPGGIATEDFDDVIWFETSKDTIDSNFEVASDYYYSSLHQSFKVKLRSTSSIQFWNYSLSELNCEVNSWEIWFACGNLSEDYELFLDLESSSGIDIARIKFVYSKAGSEESTDYVAKIYYLRPSTGWDYLVSDYSGGYLFNDWYKLRLVINETNNINYTLYQNKVGIVSSKQNQALNSLSLTDLARVAWMSTKNPVVCPIFFIDEHKLGITSI